ncbi:MAG TPA: aminoacetone oxidase family FAD-binding enzyme [Candidatus Magasanikbacteria bacterium]|nr:aminoacetone oxidase family FAD-binding enzyme [Candidatus Magasanikbacteria bacterium]
MCMKNQYDLIVIGGGAAGMVAAGIASERGAKVLLLEKNKELGRKILISGHTRCNLTHDESNIRELIKAYGDNGAFLFSALNNFPPQEIMNFFENLGVKLKIEDDRRVFPRSDSSQEIVNSLIKYLKNNKVEIKTLAQVKNIFKDKTNITGVELENGELFNTTNLLIATGGLSYPGTGSTGDGFKFAKNLGHTITPTIPSLVPLKIKETFVKDLQGLSFSDIEVSLYQNNKKITKKIGDILFTHFGISGPMILNLSKQVITARKNGNVELRINFKPKQNEKQLDLFLQKIFHDNGKKTIKNIWDNFLPSKFVGIMLDLADIYPEKLANSISKEERKKILEILHDLKLTVVGDMGFEQAIVTSGGVDLKEIDPKTMQSKLIDNLYFAGEILDIDGITGGYNLTVAWGTGYTAGNSLALPL